ncbi:MAG: hypothetical protein ABW250_19790 [Pyrinomonadaceae bacterium]
MSLTTDSGTTHERPPEALAHDAATGGLTVSAEASSAETSSVNEPAPADVDAPTLGSLPVGARLILRCRADWRAATVAFLDAANARVVLSVASPGGHTYRVRRPADSPLAYDGHFPVLGKGCWRAGLARYDVRW